MIDLSSLIMDLYRFIMIYKNNIDYFEHKNVIILVLTFQNFVHCRLKQKNFFIGRKIGYFILKGRKQKLTIKVETKNIFYLFFY
jgi:hypothetical protein